MAHSSADSGKQTDGTKVSPTFSSPFFSGHCWTTGDPKTWRCDRRNFFCPNYFTLWRVCTPFFSFHIFMGTNEIFKATAERLEGRRNSALMTAWCNGWHPFLHFVKDWRFQRCPMPSIPKWCTRIGKNANPRNSTFFLETAYQTSIKSQANWKALSRKQEGGLCPTWSTWKAAACISQMAAVIERLTRAFGCSSDKQNFAVSSNEAEKRSFLLVLTEIRRMMLPIKSYLPAMALDVRNKLSF